MQKLSSRNLVPTLRIALTEGEEHAEALHRKHSRMGGEVAIARRFSAGLLEDYRASDKLLKDEEAKVAARAKKAKRALMERREEVLRKAPHDFANYLVHLNKLQGSEK